MRILLFLLVLLLAHDPASAEWRRAESDQFIVIGELSDSDIREYAIELEQLDDAIRTLSGVTAAPSRIKFRVYVVTSASDVRGFMEERPNSNMVAGFYSGSMRGPFAVVPRRSLGSATFGLSADHILFHEYAHHFMWQYFPASYPSWYVEGFAELISTAEFDGEGRVLIGQGSVNRALGLVYDDWTPMRRLMTTTERLGIAAYSQGWLMTHHAMFDAEAGRRLREYLAGLQRGEPAEAVFDSVYGSLEPSLDQQLRRYMQQRRIGALRIGVGAIDPASIAVRTLSAEEADVAMLYPLDPDISASRVAEIVARYPENPQAHVERALAAIAARDYPSAVSAIDTALSIDPGHVEANAIKGQLLVSMIYVGGDDGDARLAEARRHLLAANRSDPASALPLYWYYFSFPDRASRPENANDALFSAFQLVPQNPEIRIALGDLYLSEGRYSEAAIAVQPLLFASHESEESESARTIWNAARQGLSGAAPAP